MGFINNLKLLFNKNIECGEEINHHIACLLPKKKIYLKKNIFVKENNVCVIVYKGRVTDVIFAGKYRLNQDSIPLTCDRAKIEKHKTKGRNIRKIRADIYYVNLQTFKHFEYKSYLPFKTKSGTLGRIKGCLSGICDIRVLDGGDLIKTLVHKEGRVRTKRVSEVLSYIVGNRINKLIQKQKISIDMLLNNQEYVESLLNADMQDALDKRGLFVSNIKLKAVDFPKKHQKKVNDYMLEHKSNIKSFKVNEVFNTGSNKVEVPVNVNIQTFNAQNNTMQNPRKVATLDSVKVCNKCGKRNSSTSKICINCGNKLN